MMIKFVQRDSNNISYVICLNDAFNRSSNIRPRLEIKSKHALNVIFSIKNTPY